MHIFRRTLKPVLYILVFGAVVLCVNPIYAYEDPNQAERDLFNTVHNRVKNHSQQMPRDVNEADESLEEDCTSETFDCPPGSDVDKVQYIICTRQVKWTGNPQDGDEAAAYVWSAPEINVEDNIKTIRYENKIMIDDSVFRANESTDIGQILNEGLLYHELLHGQIGIEYLYDAAEGLDEACKCEIPEPEDHCDEGHDIIPGLQDTFMSNIADPNTVQVHRVVIPADPNNGGFKKQLGKKNYWVGVARSPKGSNADNVELSDPNGVGEIIIQGTLSDPNKAGHILVLIDPPSVYQYYYVKVNPGAIAVATISEWGLIVLVLLMIIAGAVAIRRRLQAVA